MIKGFSKKEHEYIADVLAGSSNKYSSSYSSRLRTRALKKVLLMGEEILLFNKMYIREYNKMNQYERQIIDDYQNLLSDLRRQPFFPWEKKR